ncbi:hypothetical protein BZG36_00425 [Bifiguratus adelaidae]|uniref:Amidohydrolase-related domain-containing protein n=1 Tax=Bifiguratus adelaidae TaxID=1938954 RepID=A0A261Y7V8_9FUNG|nr:hypothetical protein BZG36_00425 [Bifiguratus adelaidae]
MEKGYIGTALPGYTEQPKGISTRKVVLGTILLLSSCLTWSLYTAAPSADVLPPAALSASISQDALREGLAKCARLHLRKPTAPPSKRRQVNPRHKTTHASRAGPQLIKKATVWTGTGSVLSEVDVLLKDGLIQKVGSNVDVSDIDQVQVIEANGRILTPGLVDLHSHLGVDGWPDFQGTSDTNEATDPLTPYVRSLEGFNPVDEAIQITASGGVTTALVLPGSANLMGGEAYVFKLRPVDTLSGDDMLAQFGVDWDEWRHDNGEVRWRYMKMACGENPKRVYGSRGRMPSTRMGSAYLFRQTFADAQNLLDAQTDWCETAAQIANYEAHYGGKHPHLSLQSRFPENLAQEQLVALLRGDVKLNVHCYEPHDLEAMVRHSHEFGFDIAAFHHALDAYRVPDIIKRARNNITIATFADHWGYKKEAYQASPLGPKILHDAGIPVALKTDHPVLNAQHLMFEAAKAAHYGLDPQDALASVTSIPAKAMGLGHRVGTLAEGYDADVVLWDRDPLSLGASPLQVWIDGEGQFDFFPESVAAVPLTKETSEVPKQLQGIESLVGKSTYVLNNVGKIFTNGEELDGPLTLVVKNHTVACLGDCREFVSNIDAAASIDVQGGHILPGFIAVGSELGMTEIGMESTTGDGYILTDANQGQDVARAIDGIKFGTRHLEEAYKGGVLTSITAPMGRYVVDGLSAAFKTGAKTAASPHAFVGDSIALHLNLGDAAKSPSHTAVSTQLAFIRKILYENRNKTDLVDGRENPYYLAASGQIPVVVSTNNKDEIASIIRLKNDIGDSVRFVILGGAESPLVATELAQAQIPVILSPALCTPSTFDTRFCLPGKPVTNETAVDVLHAHRVTIAFGVADMGLARNLAWDAGWASAASNFKISHREAVGFISWNIQSIFGLDKSMTKGLQTGQDAEFVLYNGSPFDLRSKVVAVTSPAGGLEMV